MNYQQAAALLNCEPAVIQAVAHVESNGKGFDDLNRPKILFERHIFSRLTKHKYDHSHPNLSNKNPGGYSSDEYKRLEKAKLLDHDNALKSASYGKFQIMGFNHQLAGYATVQDYVTAMNDEANHLQAFVQFILNNKLAIYLKNKDFYSFAKHYNGPDFAKNQYHIKMKQAYNLFGTKNPVQDAQEMLTDLGYDPGPIDGLYGPKTKLAILAFETKHNLPITGSIQASTIKKLRELTHT